MQETELRLVCQSPLPASFNSKRKPLPNEKMKGRIWELQRQSKLLKQQLENRIKVLDHITQPPPELFFFFFPKRTTKSRKCYRALSTRHLKLIGKCGRKKLQIETELFTQLKVQVLGYDLVIKG